MQRDLFTWADTRPTAKILDWYEPFSKRVLARLREYDDDLPKPQREATIVELNNRRGAA